MNNLPIGFRDFIIYTVPGAIFILQLIIISFLFIVCRYPNFSMDSVEPYLKLFKESQILLLFLYIVVSHFLGMLLNQEVIKYILKNMEWIRTSWWDSPLDKYLKRICTVGDPKYDNQRQKIIFDFIEQYDKEFSQTNVKLDKKPIWLMLRCIENYGDTYLKDGLNRINNLRNFCRNIFFMFVYSALFSLILLIYSYENQSTSYFLIVYFIIVIMFAYLSFNRYKKFSQWLVRSVIDAYYAVFLHKHGEDGDNEEKIILGI